MKFQLNIFYYTYIFSNFFYKFCIKLIIFFIFSDFIIIFQFYFFIFYCIIYDISIIDIYNQYNLQYYTVSGCNIEYISNIINNNYIQYYTGDGSNSVNNIIIEDSNENTLEDGLVNGQIYEDSEDSEQERDFLRIDNNQNYHTNSVITASNSDWRNSDHVEPIGSTNDVILNSRNLDWNNPFNVEINITSYYNNINYQEEFPIQESSMNSTEMISVRNGDEFDILVEDLSYSFPNSTINSHYDGQNMIVNQDQFFNKLFFLCFFYVFFMFFLMVLQFQLKFCILQYKCGYRSQGYIYKSVKVTEWLGTSL